MRDNQDLTQATIVTAFVFILDIISGISFPYQYYACFWAAVAFYTRLRIIGSDLEAVQKQLIDSSHTQPRSGVITGCTDHRDRIMALQLTLESLKKEIATLRSYIVIAIENPAVEGVKREISKARAELKEEFARIRKPAAKK